jgi:hypothetical protein
MKFPKFKTSNTIKFIKINFQNEYEVLLVSILAAFISTKKIT